MTASLLGQVAACSLMVREGVYTTKGYYYNKRQHYDNYDEEIACWLQTFLA